MNEDDRKEMEEREKKMCLPELIIDATWAFRHPILREWVKEAPSVNSIDNFVSSQFRDFGHKIELIRLMRKAVKAWKMIAKENRSDYLQTPEGWRLSDMFIFGLPTDFPGRFEKSRLDFATRIMFLPDFLRAVDCSTWPLFLREFCSEKDSDTATSSVDCWSGISSIDNFFAPKELGEKFWQGNEAEAYEGNIQELSELGYKLSFVEEKTGDGRPIACANILFRNFGICTRIVRIKPKKEGQYSRFYKTVCIRDKRYGDMTQVIKISQPIDCVRSNDEGRVVYSKRIALHRHLYMNLQIEYGFDKEFKLFIYPEHTSYDSCSFIRLEAANAQQSLLFQEGQLAPAPEEIMKAMVVLYPEFIKIWEHSIRNRKVSLESILGQEMIKNPPDSLLKFFSGEK
ncbi:MAG: hypothetical protein WC682_04405 [Parcubacteria group bacterium]|jgi:hypothetical protein